MKYAILFGLLGLAQLLLAISSGVWGVLWGWSGLSFLVVAAGYAGAGARVFGKRAIGSLSIGSVVLLLPYLLFTWTVWHLQRRLSRELCCHEIAPGLWLGRRALPHELPTGVTLIVDLTCEFPIPRGIQARYDYLSLPALDTSVPDRERFVEAVRHIAAYEGTVLLHCANGHGRSATLAVAVLMAKNLAEDVDEAERCLRKARPGVKLHPEQRVFVRKLALSSGRFGHSLAEGNPESLS